MVNLNEDWHKDRSKPIGKTIEGDRYWLLPCVRDIIDYSDALSGITPDQAPTNLPSPRDLNLPFNLPMFRDFVLDVNDKTESLAKEYDIKILRCSDVRPFLSGWGGRQIVQRSYTIAENLPQGSYSAIPLSTDLPQTLFFLRHRKDVTPDMEQINKAKEIITLPFRMYYEASGFSPKPK